MRCVATRTVLTVCVCAMLDVCLLAACLPIAKAVRLGETDRVGEYGMCARNSLSVKMSESALSEAPLLAG
jgi:hypothetical protein